jgi:hypothetical protein
MTTALCINCGTFKVGAFNVCSSCGCVPTGNIDLDLAFTDHYLSEETLCQFGDLIRTLHSETEDEGLAFRAMALLQKADLPAIQVVDNPRLDVVESHDPDMRYLS